MESVGYVDLFATKGIEYLLVLGFLGAFILYWRLLNRRPARVGATARSASAPWFRLRDGLLYHQGHSWAMSEGADVVRIGIDDFAQKLLGRPSSVLLPRRGDRIEQGETGWKLRFDRKTIDLLSPVDGEVLAVNDGVVASPSLINSDPYGDGWLMKVRVPNLDRNTKNLITGRVAQAWMEDAVARLRRAMAADLGPVLQDGGAPVSGIARNLSAQQWDKIAAEFLMTDRPGPGT